MTNAYFTPTGNPAIGAQGLSSLMRSEFISLSAAFDLLPVFAGAGGRSVVVNPGGTGLTTTTGQLALAGNLSTTGAFSTIFAQSASVTLTLPGVTGTLATTANIATETTRATTAEGVNALAISTETTRATAAEGTKATPASVAAAVAVETARAMAWEAAPVLPVASTTVSGAVKIDGGTITITGGVISAAPGAYVLPTASTSVLGGVKVDGTTITIAAGAISVAYGTSATTAAAGNDARITAAQTSAQVVTAIAAGNPGAFSTLSASGAVSGTGFSTYLASPPAIGATAPAAGKFTTLQATSPLTASAGSFETRVTMGANNIDLNTGSVFTKTIAALTTFTVSNVPASGTAASLILDLTNGGAFAITWWTGMKWAGGVAPTLTASGRDVLGFYTQDGGTTWNGLLLGKAMA